MKPTSFVRNRNIGQLAEDMTRHFGRKVSTALIRNRIAFGKETEQEMPYDTDTKTGRKHFSTEEVLAWWFRDSKSSKAS